MINVKIVKGGKEIRDNALYLLEQMNNMVSLYDPLGLHNLESPYYVMSVLNYLKRHDEIDSFKIITPQSEFPPIESEPGVVY